MAQRRFHYKQAFEPYLRDNTIPYVAVDEARRALALVTGHPQPSAGDQAPTGLQGNLGMGVRRVCGAGDCRGETRLKSFDFVVDSQTVPNLLVDVKGRKHSGRSGKALDPSWGTQSDVDGLVQWERLFGEGFAGVFAFLYWGRKSTAGCIVYGGVRASAALVCLAGGEVGGLPVAFETA